MVTTRQGSDDSAAAAGLAVPSSLELVSWLAEEAELAAKLRAVRLRIQQAKDAGVEVPPVPDCLLVIGNDGLLHLTKFVDAQSLGRLETACRKLRQLITTEGNGCWEGLAGRMGKGQLSKVGDTFRTRVIRSHLASTVAEEMEALTPAHTPGQRDAEGLPTIQCTGCRGRRWELDMDIFNKTYLDREFFVRFVNKMTGAVLAQGFVEPEVDPEEGIAPKCDSCYRPNRYYLLFPLESLDLSDWPELGAIFPVRDGLVANDIVGPMKDIINTLSITVVALPRKDSSLVKEIVMLAAASCEPQNIDTRASLEPLRVLRDNDPFSMRTMMSDPHTSRDSPYYMYRRGYRQVRPDDCVCPLFDFKVADKPGRRLKLHLVKW